MKKMCMVCMVVMCMARFGWSSLMWGALEIYVDMYPEEMAAQLREDVKDKAKLRLCMAKLASSPLPSVTVERVEAFKRKYGVGDEAMLIELMDIIREGAVKAGWTKYREGDAKDTYVSVKAHLTNAIFWLKLLSGLDAEVKSLTMGIAMDSAMDEEYRSGAFHAYMSRAGAQEARDAAARFLSDDMRMTKPLSRFNVYSAIMWAHDKAKDDTQTREVIVSAMSTALMKETKDFYYFGEADKLLAERSTEYAESPQRKAALERMNKPPEKETP